MTERYPDLETALRARGEFICPIRGVSMLPMLEQDTDAVRLVPVTGRLARYDLPLYRSPSGNLVLHRIIGVEKEGYRICGDNCAVIEHVPFDAVIAVAVGYFKRGVYIPCDDPDYRRYVRRRVRSLPFRKVKWAAGRLLRGIHNGTSSEETSD